MGRTRRVCPLCGAKSLLRLDHHLEHVHDLQGEEKNIYLGPLSQAQENVTETVPQIERENNARSSQPAEKPSTKEDVLKQLPVWDVSRVLFNEGIHLV